MIRLIHGRRRRGKPFRVLVLGGARSGKSVTAERMLAGREHVDYVATGAEPDDADPEWAARVNAHRRRRPAHWVTLETRDLEAVLTPADGAAAGGVQRLATPVLVDCLSTWLAGVMDETGLWTGRADAGAALASRVDGLLAAWQSTRRHVVAVSNEAGLGVVPATASGVRYRDELGVLNARIAAECEQVWFCVAGIARRLK
ncbi:MAG TPA: bifunctional adenosylcobinamide kinase/adenosylcobinamide-phosphate guanylyltransferase [Trebonia sp.]|jgi:adenosylcobinamide kinase/adenosylcobinamide-phosphate guanylyltransferase|nr:bifunctional adenosylcobinamide kinase/adenosylcobinamide-phosphate guanylyltransferase [Trebonia sp.]